uniref:TSA: Wollemia nobilis Ref_Wollemi_Transcript_1461_1329 transcribed RNA sequence n=1 Tax=Wollemia nobilis TaxID=56998 RepID=A0A0C9S9A5_9CONI
MALSNNITGALNFASGVLSVLIIGTGIWLASKEDAECLKFLRWPLIVIGVVLLLVSLAGFVGAFWKIPILLVLYLFFMFIFIVLLLALVIFAFVVTHKGTGHPAFGRNYDDYQLSDFSGWLKHYVENTRHWNRVKNCLSSSDLCRRLDQRYLSAQDFFGAHLTPLESGCCKPPTVCGYNFVNPTYWISPIYPNADTDCMAWSNDQMQLCFNCNSCKAGLLGNVKREWKRINIILIVVLVALIWVYLIGCSAFRNAQTEELFRRYKERIMS